MRLNADCARTERSRGRAAGRRITADRPPPAAPVAPLLPRAKRPHTAALRADRRPGGSLTPSLLRALLTRFASDADLPPDRQLIGFLPAAEAGSPDLARQLTSELQALAPTMRTQLLALGRSSAGSQLTVAV